MQHDEFIGHVQHRARMSSRGDAESATRATLEILAGRLAGGAADNLASQLPQAIGDYLRNAEDTEIAKEMSLDDFFGRVSEKTGVDLPKSVHHTRCVISVLQDAVSEGQIEKIKDQFPSDWDRLFESGSEGSLGRDN